LRHLAHRLGWLHVRLWLSGLQPARLRSSWRWTSARWAEVRARRQEPRLTVAIDISPFWEPLTGIGWYLYRLLEALAERDDVRVRLYGPDLVDKRDVPPPRVELPTGPAIERVSYRIPEDYSVVYYWLSDRLRARERRLVDLDRNRVLFAPNYFLPPRLARCRGLRVATIHDLTVEKFPETMRESTRRELQASLRQTAATAVRVLTDSEAVRQEIAAAGLAPLGRVHAVHLAPASGSVGVEAVRPEGLPERYVLFVGTVEPRKNLATLLGAFERWQEDSRDEVKLLMCGGRGWKNDDLEPRIEAAREQGWLLHLGYLPEEQLAGLYENAEWVALPSLYEGFGLPAVEAMAWGVPLLLADIPVLREVGGDAALYAPPESPSAWVELLERATTEDGLRSRMAERSARRAREFDWQRTADATVEVWRLAASAASAASEGGISEMTEGSEP
jgi:alpha-1,3-rhamnosyl/mannosyltransferase